MRQIQNNCVHCDVCYGCGRKNNYEQIYCDRCGGEIEEEELHEEDGQELCEDCYHQKVYEDHKEKLTLETAMKLGEEDTEKVELNGFITYYLTPSQINEICAERLAQTFRPSDLTDYLDDNGEYERIIDA